MTNVTEYTNLKKKASGLYTALKAVRMEIHAMEQRMIQEMTATQSPMLSVISDSRPGIIKIQDRTRRVPLSELDLQTKLQACLHELFGQQVTMPKIQEFSISISGRIWAERRVKCDQKVVFKAMS